MCWFLAEHFVTGETLCKATEPDAPAIFNQLIAEILVQSMGIEGGSNIFCRCKNGGYNLTWILADGSEVGQTFTEDELLEKLKGKIFDYSLNIRKGEC